MICENDKSERKAQTWMSVEECILSNGEYSRLVLEKLTLFLKQLKGIDLKKVPGICYSDYVFSWERFWFSDKNITLKYPISKFDSTHTAKSFFFLKNIPLCIVIPKSVQIFEMDVLRFTFSFQRVCWQSKKTWKVLEKVKMVTQWTTDTIPPLTVDTFLK